MGKNMADSKNTSKLIIIYLFCLLAISIITLAIWSLTGSDFSFSLVRAVSVFVVGFPCALKLSTIYPIKIGMKKARENGIVFNDETDIEGAGKTEIVAVDNAGIITEAVPIVSDVSSADHFTMSGYAVGGYSDDELVEVAAVLTSRSAHPVAKAITKYTNEMIVELDNILTNFKEHPGIGLEGEIDGIPVRGGTLKFIEENVPVSSEVSNRAHELSQEGESVVFFSKGKRLLGLISLSNKIKIDSIKSIVELKHLGLKVILLSADQEETAKAIADKVGADDSITYAFSEGKEEKIKELSEKAKIYYVNSENNESMDIALSKISLSRQISKKIKENIMFFLAYCIIFIPMAAGLYYHALGLVIDPIPGAVLLIFSVVVVVANSLRLNKFQK